MPFWRNSYVIIASFFLLGLYRVYSHNLDILQGYFKFCALSPRMSVYFFNSILDELVCKIDGMENNFVGI